MNTIQATELRIGNWVYDDDGIESRVIGFQPFGHSVRCDEAEGCDVLIDLFPQDGSIRYGLICESSAIKPIPLNEDWLVRFGFELVEKQYDAQEFNVYKNSYFTWNSNHGWWFCNINIENKAKIKYVHQLQNLYFALTGIELTLTDK